MKRVILLLSAVIASVMIFATQAVAQKGATNEFLAKNYGWYFGIEQKSQFFKWSWNIVCDQSKVALPEKGKNVFSGWSCRQEDPTCWTVILWRLPSIDPAAIERSMFNSITGGLGYGKVEAEEDRGPFPGSGTIKDCSVPLQGRGNVSVSFYHFEARAPAPYTVVINNGTVTSNRIAFTIYVANSRDSGSQAQAQVKEKLREIVGSIKFTAAE